MSGGVSGDHELARAYIARVIRERRALLGLNKREAARRAGITHGCLSRYERGLVLPSVHILLRLCNGLHMSPGRLIDNLAGELAMAESPRYAAPAAPPNAVEVAGTAAGAGIPPCPSAGGEPICTGGEQ